MGRSNRIELIESIFRGMIRESSLDEVCTALHNACVHGEIFENGITDEDLEKLYEIFDNLLKHTRKMEC